MNSVEPVTLENLNGKLDAILATKIKNATQKPKVYYGMHFVDGVAEYREPGVNDGKPFRIFIPEDTAKEMDLTFSGCPVYVDHVDGVDYSDIQNADGFVVESFFNECDGKHWAKFIITSDRGHEAIKSGWKLSNAYSVKNKNPGSVWNGVEYAYEVADGEYEHLAIVKNPRYAESEIFTPERFRDYQKEKEEQNKKQRFQNSKKGETKMSFIKNIWKKQKVEKIENEDELKSMVFELPKSKKEISFEELITNADEIAEKEAQDGVHPMCNMDDYVNVGDQKMKVSELLNAYTDILKAKKVEDEDSEKDEEVDNIDQEDAEDEIEEADDSEDEKGEPAEKKKNSKGTKFSEVLRNAPFSSQEEKKVIEISSDLVARGKQRYGR